MTGSFRKRSQMSSLSREALDRQGRILNIAIQVLGAGGAMTFLNAYHPGLDAKPLDLAIASPEGFKRVERAMLES
ncbi:MAG: hypothetical protein KGJ57_21655 [Sphingomonadales bacterium]|nr:hypothetical protein [Sphingomonadales bacterium]MDE2171999.1 hypothetical protein [Sphingomonadales bacterium]